MKHGKGIKWIITYVFIAFLVILMIVNATFNNLHAFFYENVYKVCQNIVS